MRTRRRKGRGQAMLEFALLAPTIGLMCFGMIDLGDWYQDHIAVQTAARGGARYASFYPTVVTASAAGAPNTIEGVIQAESSPVTIPNDDSHIAIKYYAWNPERTPGTETLCASYSQASNSFTYQAGYSQNTCIISGNLVKVTVTYTWTSKTPIISNLMNFNTSISSTYTMAIA